MTQEEKTILLQDLCSRLPHGVQVCVERDKYTQATLLGVNTKQFNITFGGSNWSSTSNIEGHHIEQYKQLIKPYLRPMESMTEDEVDELKRICDEYDLHDECGDLCSTIYGMSVLYGEVENDYPYNLKIKISPKLNYVVLDYLIAHHFDYRGLIPMGLALPAKEGMYNE